MVGLQSLTSPNPDSSAARLLQSTTETSALLDRLLISYGFSAASYTAFGLTESEFGEIPFQALLTAIERAGPQLSALAETRLYTDWIAANRGRSPVLYAAWFNVGVALGRHGDQANAETAYKNALALKPDLYQAAINLGLQQEAKGKPEEAFQIWERAIQPDVARNALLIQKGRLFEKLGRLEEAEETLRSALAITPDQPDVIHHWMHIRQKICRWPTLPADCSDQRRLELLHGCGPLSILALTDDIATQRRAADAWVARKTQSIASPLSPSEGYRHARIRVGYLSSDFCRHAMSYLIAELFERHDRARFEIFGYCSSPDDKSDIRNRISAAFDHYRVIRDMSDEDAAGLIRKDEIDLLIDLNGITDGTRLQVLRWRPAPVQATYLGFIGPIPMPELDYLFCDDFVIPPEHAGAYQPTPLAIAQTYQANDSKRLIGRTVSRSEAGLPADRFVFCCFSRHYKITREVFDVWMAILRRTDAVLWLAADNQWSQSSIHAAATEGGIAVDRIIFADRTDPELYMTRLQLADVFLDTFPYNAGTVASDAIRMEVPLLTLCGRAFASRMAGSLLTSLGAGYGISVTLAEYLDKAVILATDPVAYRRYKGLFTAEAWRQSIGNIGHFTTQFENTIALVVKAGEARAGAGPI